MEKVEVGDLIVITKACEWTEVGQIGEVIHVHKDGSGVDAKFAHDPDIPIETGAFDIFRKNGEEAPVLVRVTDCVLGCDTLQLGDVVRAELCSEGKIAYPIGHTFKDSVRGRGYFLTPCEFEIVDNPEDYVRVVRKQIGTDRINTYYRLATEYESPAQAEEATPSREQAITNASHALGDLLARKNADYGNSFAEQYSEYGLLSVIIRLDDKLRRLKSLANSQEGAKVADEAIADTLLDMAGYALLASVEESDSEAV